MQTTSHFIGLEIESELFSDLYVKLYEYLKSNNIEDIIIFQNILSLHITLYYLGENITQDESNKIKELINSIEKNIIINTGDLRYFKRANNKIIGYFFGNSSYNLQELFSIFHKEFDETRVLENDLSFVPHITIFRIKDSSKYESHRENIEKIINEELEKLKNINLTTNNISLYKVNSNFPGEIQIKSH